MNKYRPVQRTTHSGTRRLAYLSAIAIVVLAADFFTHGAVRQPLRYLETKWSQVVRTSVSDIAQSRMFASSAALSDENAVLREELARYRSLALSASALQQQNAALARTAKLALVRPGVTAPVASSESTLGTFLVGGGRQDGVAVGDIVRSDDGFVVGTVITVQETTALCRSIFAPGAMIDATVRDSHVQLQGRGASNARGQAPRDSKIAVGDLVTSASVRGYPIAEVGNVVQDSAGAFLEVYVRLPQEISAIRYVFIERP
jgi:cell shape-determining protein MreC